MTCVSILGIENKKYIEIELISVISVIYNMATYDNKIWLLKNIRDAFIATDDTGLCEIVMAGEDFSKVFQNKAIEEKKRIREGRLMQPGPSKHKDGMGDISEEEIGKEIVTQFDPYPDMDDSEDDDPLCGSYVRYEDLGGYRYTAVCTFGNNIYVVC